MVLQRNADVRLWGWADPNEEVQVLCDWLEAPVTTTAGADGTWNLRIKTGDAGKPHSITFKASNTVTITDVLFGEVWLASGQSNMEMPLVEVSKAYTGIQNAREEVAAADYPEIRLFQAGNFSSDQPLEDVQPGIQMYGIPPAQCEWQLCSPKSVPTFSSTAYFFARELHRTLGIPIGIIDSSWGGTSAEAWTPARGLKSLSYENDLKLASEAPQKGDSKIPTRLYNGMIHPVRHMTIQGVIWYQGEGNSGRAEKYRELFSTMIHEWRRSFDSELSFYFAQISPFGYENRNAAFLREAQLQTQSLPGTGMAVTMDIGNLTDIHPKNKQEVGRRLALWALANDYDQEIVCSGPVFEKATFDGPSATLSFESTADGLSTNDGKSPSHFELAGEDRVFHPATAQIDGETITVKSDAVATPKAVRYAFSSGAMPNLINSAGLPASSFRSDQW